MTFKAHVKKGMTLVEMIITVALFGFFSLLVAYLIINTSKNYNRGKITQELRSQTNMLLDRIVQDIERGVALPTVDGGTGGATWIASPVVLPNPYQVAGSARGDDGSGVARNRLIVTIEAGDVYQATPTMRFIEYIVPENQNNVVYRRSYDAKIEGNGYKGFQPMGNVWLVNDEYFSLENVRESLLITQLPDKLDVITFTITQHLLDSEDPTTHVKYDPYLFTVEVEMKRFLKRDLNHPVIYKESTDALVRARAF